MVEENSVSANAIAAIINGLLVSTII